jgi:hypothetical protein
VVIALFQKGRYAASVFQVIRADEEVFERDFEAFLCPSILHVPWLSFPKESCIGIRVRASERHGLLIYG